MVLCKNMFSVILDFRCEVKPEGCKFKALSISFYSLNVENTVFSVLEEIEIVPLRNLKILVKIL